MGAVGVDWSMSGSIVLSVVDGVEFSPDDGLLVVDFDIGAIVGGIVGDVGVDWSIAGSIEVFVEVIGAGAGSNVRSMLL